VTVRISRDSRRSDRIRVDAPLHYNDLIRSIPGASWSNVDGYWTIPLAWTACLASRSIFRNDLDIAPDLLEWAVDERARRIDPAMSLRDALDAPGDPALYPHQRAGVEFLVTAERALLADEPGVGKSLQALRALKKLHDDGKDVFPVLLVCPNSMKRTWKREFAAWWPEVTTVVVDGTAVQRRKQLDSGAQVVIINWEALRSHSRLARYGSLALRACAACGGWSVINERQCQVHERELNRIEFRSVVADEAHRAKSPKAQATLALRGATGDAPYRFALTGTPISNTPDELWSILHWMDPAEWPAKSRWMDRMVNFSLNVWGGLEVTGLKPEAEAEFQAGVHPRMRRMTKEVVLASLPEKVFERRDVPVTGRQLTAYRQMSEDLIAKLDSGILLSANPMVQTGRLIQFASSMGDVLVDETGAERLVLTAPSSKIDAFMSDLEDFSGRSVVVFAQSRQLINLLSAEMLRKQIRHGLITGDQNTDQRQQAIDGFQRGDFQFMLCTIQAGGVGITLTKASVAVFLQRSWSPIDMEQAYNRVHRIGSEAHDSVLIVNYVAPGTVEEAQLWALDHKNGLLQQIVHDEDLMRKFLRGEING
jgi:SNF2 family DNA or RNA helicase